MVEHGADAERGGLPVPAEKNGFALAVVVFLLFAITVAGAAAFQAVRTEARLATDLVEADQALVFASAGLDRFVGETVGLPPTERYYDFGWGGATVRARAVAPIGPTEMLYLVSSEGVYRQPGPDGAPARRIVHQHAILHRLPLPPVATFSTTSDDVRITDAASVSGTDIAPVPCDVAPAPALAGLWSPDPDPTLRTDGTLNGDPAFLLAADGDDLVDALRIPWSTLLDADFPVDYEEEWPDFSGGSPGYPSIRVRGDFSPDASMSGWGVLIVTGDFRPRDGFVWRGVILAGGTIPSLNRGYFEVRGLLVVGLDQAGRPVTIRDGALVAFDSCELERSGKALAYLELVEGSWWEEY